MRSVRSLLAEGLIYVGILLCLASCFNANKAHAQDSGYFAQQTYVASGSTATFNIPFPYLHQTDITVYVSGVLQSTGTYTFPTTGQLTLGTIPAASTQVRIVRATQIPTPAATFNGGSLSSADLNRNASQGLYASQELRDTILRGVILTGSLPTGIDHSGVANVALYGALGNSSAAADTAAFQAAIAYACSTASGNGGVAEVDIPVPPVAYTINASLNVCTNLHIHGIGGLPTINFTPAGSSGSPASLFTNAGQDNVEIDHLDMEGTSAAYAFGYRAVSNASSALNFRLHDNFFNAWGDGTHGAWVSIESDSGANAIWNNYGTAKTANISITGPTDRMHIYDNLLSSVNGTCIVGASGAGGAATIKVDHNIFECEKGGAISLNTLGEWIITDNEEETLTAITNADSAVYDFNNVTLMQFDRNTSNSHGFANYDVFVNNAITNSVFSNTSTVSAVLSSFKIGTGLGNLYLYNNSGNGPSHVYDVDYAGIVTNQLYGGKGVAYGCGVTTTGTIPTTFCRGVAIIMPGTTTTRAITATTPALAAGQTAAIDVGQDFSTGNAGEFSIFWNGANNASNRAQMGLANGVPWQVDINGNSSTNGTISSIAGYKSNGNTGVSCAAGTMNIATMTTSLGIVTHC